MAINIITPGDPEKLDPKRTFTCTKCACKFEARRSDFTASNDQREPEPYLQCPTVGCTHTFYWINISNMSQQWWDR